MQWECVDLAFTPGSVDSAVDTGFYHLGFDLNVRPGEHANVRCGKRSASSVYFLSSQNCEKKNLFFVVWTTVQFRLGLIHAQLISEF